MGINPTLATAPQPFQKILDYENSIKVFEEGSGEELFTKSSSPVSFEDNIAESFRLSPLFLRGIPPVPRTRIPFSSAFLSFSSLSADSAMFPDGIIAAPFAEIFHRPRGIIQAQKQHAEHYTPPCRDLFLREVKTKGLL